MKFAFNLFWISVVISLFCNYIGIEHIDSIWTNVYCFILAFVYIGAYWMNLCYAEHHVKSPETAGDNCNTDEMNYYIHNEKHNLKLLVYFVAGNLVGMILFYPLSITVTVVCSISIIYTCYKLLKLNRKNMSF